MGEFRYSLLVWGMIAGMTSLLTSQEMKGQSTNPAPVLEQAFHATHAQVEQYSVRGWALMKGKWMEREEAIHLANRLASSMNMKGMEEQVSEKTDETQVKIYGEWDDQTHIGISVLSMKHPQMDVQTVAIVKIDDTTRSLDQLDKTWAQLQKAAYINGIPMEIGTTLQGTVNIRMNEQQQGQWIKDAFSSVGAKEVEGFQSPLLTSLSAYSPKIEDNIISNKHAVNLQIAVHDDTFHQTTRVVLGSPVITVEY